MNSGSTSVSGGSAILCVAMYITKTKLSEVYVQDAGRAPGLCKTWMRANQLDVGQAGPLVFYVRGHGVTSYKWLVLNLRGHASSTPHVSTRWWHGCFKHIQRKFTNNVGKNG